MDMGFTRFCFLAVSKFTYRLTFNTYKTIFTDRLGVFRIDQYFLKIILILVLIFGILRSHNSSVSIAMDWTAEVDSRQRQEAFSPPQHPDRL
jgi:hypothetical protein